MFLRMPSCMTVWSVPLIPAFERDTPPALKHIPPSTSNRRWPASNSHMLVLGSSWPTCPCRLDRTAWISSTLKLGLRKYHMLPVDLIGSLFRPVIGQAWYQQSLMTLFSANSTARSFSYRYKLIHSVINTYQSMFKIKVLGIWIPQCGSLECESTV